LATPGVVASTGYVIGEARPVKKVPDYTIFPFERHDKKAMAKTLTRPKDAYSIKGLQTALP
jgi:hypothetical protein